MIGALRPVDRRGLRERLDCSEVLWAQLGLRKAGNPRLSGSGNMMTDRDQGVSEKNAGMVGGTESTEVDTIPWVGPILDDMLQIDLTTRGMK